jgi:adenosylcobinamide-GDP ribazoletransferase
LLGTALACVVLTGLHGLWVLLIAVLAFAWLRRLMCRRLGGATGDTAGALLELLELAVLVGWVLLV